MDIATYTVTGMTCGHCVDAVTKELKGISGVEDVVIDLGAGKVEVTSAVPVDPAAVRGAVEEAGYQLV
jgi:copper chaperone CopZ